MKRHQDQFTQSRPGNNILTCLLHILLRDIDYDLVPFFLAAALASFSFFAFSLIASSTAISCAFSFNPSLLRAI